MQRIRIIKNAIKPTLVIILLLTAIFLFTQCHKANIKPAPNVDTPAFTFNNVLILGNSITYTPAQQGTEWTGSWGMAATTADSDYVHVLTAKLKKVNPKCVVTAFNISAWEYAYDTYDITNFSSYTTFNPDLVIFRIGEDVVQSPLDTLSFGAHYRALLKYFSNNSPVILAVGSIWSRPVTDAVMRQNTKNFITLANLGADDTIYSFGAWQDPGIQQHPNDRGMRLIADTIWAKVQQLRYQIKK